MFFRKLKNFITQSKLYLFIFRFKKFGKTREEITQKRNHRLQQTLRNLHCQQLSFSDKCW